MVEQPLSAADVDFVTNRHAESNVLGRSAAAARHDGPAVALGELEETGDEPEDGKALRPAARALEHSLRSLRDAV